ncbi:hypothetical protein ODJ79_28770 [Actinoplanes sp. KI2]|uniref:hypothetical protein n=1 Tax=Actinoplanes sp. KI2 TaxID=2983315 RepID=UPI0021D58BE9|nr:hypothetical protein [Actinoplanes sp. KI2]MCU7727730.1 hypothetical protein [Actinoplanes sp. KI2]
MHIRTDDEAIGFDVAALLAGGRFTEALVPAALQADRAGVIPRSLTFLAEIVRRGGVAYAAELAEPLPTPEQTELVRPWLQQLGGLPQAGGVAPVGGLPQVDERLARWLDGVATIIEARRLTSR